MYPSPVHPSGALVSKDVWDGRCRDHGRATVAVWFAGAGGSSEFRVPCRRPGAARARTRTRRRLRERGSRHPDPCAVRVVCLQHSAVTRQRRPDRLHRPRSFWQPCGRWLHRRHRARAGRPARQRRPRPRAHQAYRGYPQQAALYRRGRTHCALDEPRVRRNAFRVPAPVLTPGWKPARCQGRRRRVDR